MKIAYCDDERVCIEHFQKMMNELRSKLGFEIQCSTYSSGMDLLREKKDYDCYFLDVEMPVLDGFQVAEELLKRKKDFKIAFLTSHIELAPASFHYGAYRYLTKPLSPFFLEEAIQSIHDEALKTTLFIETNDGVRKLAIKDIFAIEVKGRKTVVHLENEELSTKKTMKEWEERFSENKDFFPCNRGILIHLPHVEKAEHFQVYFNKSELVLPVAIKKFRQVKHVLKNRVLN